MPAPAKLTTILGMVLILMSAVPYLIFSGGQFFWPGGFIGLFLICMGVAVMAWDRVPVPLSNPRR